MVNIAYCDGDNVLISKQFRSVEVELTDFHWSDNEILHVRSLYLRKDDLAAKY